ncbi:O-antigen ligase family protein [Acidobacteriota bacterium]
MKDMAESDGFSSSFLKVSLAAVFLAIFCIGIFLGARTDLSFYVFACISLALICLIAFVRPLYGLLIIIVYDLVIPFLTDSIHVIFIGSAFIISIVCLSLLWRHQVVLFKDKRRFIVDCLFFLLVIMTCIHLIVGIARSHDLEFIFGDFYHLFFQIFMPFFAAVAIFDNREKVNKFVDGFIYITFIGAVVITALYFSGKITGLEQADFVGVGADDSFLRLGFATGFPFFHLIFAGIFMIYVDSGRKRLVLYVTFILLAIILALTLKRTFWLATIVSLGAALLLSFLKDSMRFVKNGLLFFVISLLILAAVGFSQSKNKNIFESAEILKERLLSIDVDNPSLVQRTWEYEGVVKAISRNPAGSGLGTAVKTYSTGQHKIVWKHFIHNSYLKFALQLGILGCGVYIAIFLLFFRESMRSFFNLKDCQTRGMVLALCAASSSFMISALATATWNNIYFSIAIAIVFALRRFEEESVSSVIQH